MWGERGALYPWSILPVAAESWAPPSWWTPLWSWASSTTLRNAPWWWDALAQMSRMQQKNHPGWRTAGPSVTPSAQPISSWKPLVLKIWSTRWEKQDSDVELRRLFFNQTRATGGIVTSQLSLQNYPDWFSLCVSSLSLSLLCHFEKIVQEKSKYLFSASFTFSLFGSLDQSKWDNRCSPALLNSCALPFFPVDFLWQG